VLPIFRADLVSQTDLQYTQAGAKTKEISLGHPPGGVSSHTYAHINFFTKEGIKGTIQIKPF
jgi:hypothetical protein